MIISKTPLRISFAGGGTDLPYFYRNNSFGAVLNSSIDKYLYVTVKKHCHLYPEKIRLNYSAVEQVNYVEDIQNPIIKACLIHTGIDDRIYISTVSDAPGSSGLGSSSSFCVGLLHCLYSYRGKKVCRGRLAEEAAFIEIDVLNRPMGKQDHYAASFGGVNFIRFNSNDTCDLSPIYLDNLAESFLFSNLLTFWTGIQRNSSEILDEQNKKTEVNSEILSQMRKQATDLFNVCRSKNPTIHQLGQIMHNGWEMKRSLATKVTNEFIDKSYEIALLNGALGGKLSGAGGGGFLNVVVPSSKQEQVRVNLENNGLIYFPIGLDTEGTTIISRNLTY